MHANNLNMPHMTPRPSGKSHTNLISCIYLDSFCPKEKILRIRNNWGLSSGVVALQWCHGFEENMIAFTETSLKKEKWCCPIEAINKSDADLQNLLPEYVPVSCKRKAPLPIRQCPAMDIILSCRTSSEGILGG